MPYWRSSFDSPLNWNPVEFVCTTPMQADTKSLFHTFGINQNEPPSIDTSTGEVPTCDAEKLEKNLSRSDWRNAWGVNSTTDMTQHNSADVHDKDKFS